MKNQTIKKSIDINASKEKVWDVLTNDSLNRIWFNEFSEGTKADTDWQIGSKAIFTDSSGMGIIGKIAESKPGEYLSIEYLGVAANGAEDYESEEAKSVIGNFENYTLTENNGITHLDISSDMGAEYFDMMSAAWDKAVLKIKELAEKN